MFNAIKVSLIEERNKAIKKEKSTEKDNDDERSRNAARFLPCSSTNESTRMSVAILDLWSGSKASWRFVRKRCMIVEMEMMPGRLPDRRDTQRYDTQGYVYRSMRRQ